MKTIEIFHHWWTENHDDILVLLWIGIPVGILLILAHELFISLHLY
jgi:hypothetical protein